MRIKWKDRRSQNWDFLFIESYEFFYQNPPISDCIDIPHFRNIEAYIVRCIWTVFIRFGLIQPWSGFLYIAFDSFCWTDTCPAICIQALPENNILFHARIVVRIYHFYCVSQYQSEIRWLSLFWYTHPAIKRIVDSEKHPACFTDYSV